MLRFTDRVNTGKLLISLGPQFVPLYNWWRASLVAQMVKNSPATRQTWVQSLGWEDLLEKGMATHSNILAWRIPWTEDPGGLQSMGSPTVGHDRATNTNYWSSTEPTANVRRSSGFSRQPPTHELSHRPLKIVKRLFLSYTYTHTHTHTHTHHPLLPFAHFPWKWNLH